MILGRCQLQVVASSCCLLTPVYDSRILPWSRYGTACSNALYILLIVECLQLLLGLFVFWDHSLRLRKILAHFDKVLRHRILACKDLLVLCKVLLP